MGGGSPLSPSKIEAEERNYLVHFREEANKSTSFSSIESPHSTGTFKRIRICICMYYGGIYVYKYSIRPCRTSYMYMYMHMFLSLCMHICVYYSIDTCIFHMNFVYGYISVFMNTHVCIRIVYVHA
jgi:hypothetical protein